MKFSEHAKTEDGCMILILFFVSISTTVVLDKDWHFRIPKGYYIIYVEINHTYRYIVFWGILN